MARSAFRSQNVQNTPCTDHFWSFRCRKSARRCGAKHISKSKCTPCTDHFWRFRCSFVWQAQRIVDLVTNEQNVRVLRHLQPQPPLHYTTRHSNTLNYTTTTTTTTPSLHYLPLHYITLHNYNCTTTPHYITPIH